MMNEKLKRCPFCGGEVSIAITGYDGEKWWLVTRGHYENSCKCRVFFESEKFYGEGAIEKQNLIKAWNRRTDSEEIKEYKDAIQSVCDKFESIDECRECPIQEYGLCP